MAQSFHRIVMLAATALVGLATAAAAGQAPKPMFAVIPKLSPNIHGQAPAVPATWTFHFTYAGSSYSDAFIGANPSSATSQTVPVYLIPLKMVYGSTTEDATSIIPNIEASPIFTPMDFKFGGTDIGVTQYEDAFQKANLWGIGGSAAGYHVLLGTPTVTATQTLKVPAKQGGTFSAFGANVIGANINWFNPKVAALITKLKIPSNALPIFVTTETYLLGSASTSNCCIGGYHTVSAAGQPYSHFTYIKEAGAFSQDVSALSHELGEWIEDPGTNNNSPCGILEVGDPLEGDANYGDYPYVLNGVTYHLQDLALLPYFGAPNGTTLGNLKTLQGTSLSVCQNGS